MPPKNKRHDKTHDRRNESGLAAPGRKISKQRSNGHLDVHSPNGKASSGDAPAASAAAAAAAAASPPTEAVTTQDSANLRDCLTADSSTLADPLVDPAAGDGSQLYNASSFGPDTLADRAGNDSTLASRHRTDTIDSKMDAAAYSGSDSSSPVTVIRPHSMRDVVSILLLLLQLPPKPLFFVQVCYAVLTFGSFSGAGFSFASLTSAFEWSQSRAEAPTSLVSTIVCDLAFTFVWLCIPWGRDFTLDIAQIVMAISLGGGAASQGDGWTLPIFGVCLTLLGGRHAFRHEAPRKHAANIFWALAARANMTWLSLPLSMPELAKSAAAGHPWPRAVLELHIITQGISRIIRRLFTNNALSAQAASAKRSDQDAQSSLQVPSVSANDITTSDAAANAAAATAAGRARSPSTDGRPPGQPPAGREHKEKYVSFGKRRRRQATFVRSQQPFWAAIANTKVTVSKEMEQSQASRDSYEAGATGIADLGGVSSSAVEDRVWIVRVDDTEIEFEAHLQRQAKGKRRAQDDSENPGGGSDDTSELQVRVNDADWASATFSNSHVSGKNLVIRGRIYGLTALTEYEITFLRRGVESGLICTMALLTRQTSSDDVGSAAVVAQAPQLQGKLSAGSTVKQAIAGAERDLAETKNRSKKCRRDHKNATSALQKEVSHLKDRLQTFGGADVRQRQREIQFRQNIRQAEDAATEISEEIGKMGPVPKDEQRSYEADRAAWEAAQEHRDGLRHEYEGVKSDCDKSIAGARGENQSVAQKREKLQARLQRLDGQRDELDTSNVQTREARARRERDRKALLGAREIQERNYHQQISTIEAQTHDIRYRTSQFDSQLQVLEQGHAMGSQQPFASQIPVPHTPESSYAALRGNVPTFSSPFAPQQQQQSHFALGAGTPPVASRRGSLVAKSRERKSSMLSDASGFTDDALGETAVSKDGHFGPIAYDAYGTLRNGSDGSGHSSAGPFAHYNGYGATGNNGTNSGGAGSSRRDSPTSPGASSASVARLSPIGKGASPKTTYGNGSS